MIIQYPEPRIPTQAARTEDSIAQLFPQFLWPKHPQQSSLCSPMNTAAGMSTCCLRAAPFLRRVEAAYSAPRGASFRSPRHEQLLPLPRAFLPPRLSSSSFLPWQRELRRRSSRGCRSASRPIPSDLRELRARGTLWRFGWGSARRAAAKSAFLWARGAAPRFAKVEKAVSVFLDCCVHF